jgi:tRNA1(Val) A37 N6-methylase TrmN6
MTEPSRQITEDAFLGGKLHLRQLKSGHRAGHDAILLAAATSARSGDRVVDLGAGVGAAGLALAKRLAGIDLVLVEIDETLAELARGNAVANAIAADVVVLDVMSAAAEFAAAGLIADSVDVVLMNPPFNDAVRHRASPDKAREMAHVATGATLEGWIHAARRILKSGGVLTLIWRADGVVDLPASPAIRVLVRAIKGGKAPLRMHAALILNSEAATPNPQVQDVLAGKGILPLALP